MMLLSGSGFQAPTSVVHAFNNRSGLGIHAELYDVPIVHDVLFALDAGLASRTNRSHGAERHQVVEGDDFGLDEVILEVRVDLASRLGRSGPTVDGPGSCLLRARGEERLEAEGVEPD